MKDPRGAVVLAVVLAVLTAALGAGVAVRGLLPLPVVAVLGDHVVRIATLHLALGVLVPPVLVAAVVAVRATGRFRRTADVWAAGASAPIVLVLVARMNGAADAAVLVLVYAATAGGAVLRSFRGSGDAPIRWAAVLGVVPWGVVAFEQVGGLLAGSAPPPAVRLLTVLVLAASVLEYVLAYRRRHGEPDVRPSALALVALPSVLLAVGTIALVG